MLNGAQPLMKSLENLASLLSFCALAINAVAVTNNNMKYSFFSFLFIL